MGRMKREFKENYCYHIYNRGNRKQRIFYKNEDKLIFLEKLRFLSLQNGVQIVQVCLMLNHFHLTIRLSWGSISVFMHNFMGFYAKQINKRYTLTGHLFQSRYQFKEVHSCRQLLTLIEYIRKNPVKANLSKSFLDYKWYREDTNLISECASFYEELVHLKDQTLKEKSIFIDDE